MNQFANIPLDGRLAILLAVGICIGGLVNLAVYRLAWRPRRISPWWLAEPNAPPRRWFDRLPIVGWWFLRREASLHGRGFWIRPMLLEVGCGVGLAALYWWEIVQGGLLPPELPRPIHGPMLAAFHWQFLAHGLLMTLMLIASTIDLDEKTIPDAITVPGVWLGLLLAAVLPWTLLPDPPLPPGMEFAPDFWQHVEPARWPFLCITSPMPPNQWPDWLDGRPQLASLAIGLGCWWLWCVALLPRAWYGRYGFRRAWRYFWARLVRHRSTWLILAMGLIGTAAIAAGWYRGGIGWVGLLSALVGMAAAGGLVWMVRILGTATLGREAMGFGDVTLMAMIGTFLGWQTCLLVFFLAPLVALVFGLAQLFLRHDSEIPYGPFLCLAAAAAVVGWASLWQRTCHIFSLGWFVPVVVLVCLVLMGLMLGGWSWFRGHMGW